MGNLINITKEELGISQAYLPKNSDKQPAPISNIETGKSLLII